MEEDIYAALSLRYSPPLSVPRSFGLPQLLGGVRRGPAGRRLGIQDVEARNPLTAVTTSQALSGGAKEANGMDEALSSITSGIDGPCGKGSGK